MRARCLAVSLITLVLAPPASAGSWRAPTPAGHVNGTDVSAAEAKHRIRDRVFDLGSARASSHQPARVEQYTDQHGHTILIGTSIADLNLQPYAEILAGTIHRDELDELRALIVLPSEMSAECGGGDGVVACYGADDPDQSFSGEMIIPSESADLVHAIVHEYGHHMDNQLVNLGHLGLCPFDTDGSRRWFFERDAYDDLWELSGCSEQVGYGRQLGELYAEDFVALNGIKEWFTSDFPPPTDSMLDAMYDDIYRRFEPTTRRWRGWLKQGYYTPRWIKPKTPVFLRATLIGPGPSDYDLYVMKPGRRKAIGRSAKRGSREVVEMVVGPGRYRIDVSAYRGRGSYRLRVDLN